MSNLKDKPESYWQEKLSAEEYHICREKGTEAPFTGKYYECKENGTYLCVCCEEALFSSEKKYDSGSGWPSFTEAIQSSKVDTQEDTSLDRVRTEVLCSNCGAHLGHVFNDGPAENGLRYCINSSALNLKKK